MSLFSEFRTRPRVKNWSKRHFAKFLPFAGLCDFVNSLYFHHEMNHEGQLGNQRRDCK
jgi:hypothetical protein